MKRTAFPVGERGLEVRGRDPDFDDGKHWNSTGNCWRGAKRGGGRRESACKIVQVFTQKVSTSPLGLHKQRPATL